MNSRQEHGKRIRREMLKFVPESEDRRQPQDRCASGEHESSQHAGDNCYRQAVDDVLAAA